MTRRSDFLAALGLTGAAAGVPANALALGARQADASPSGAPATVSPAPSPTPSEKPPSAVALATAQSMRAFDSALTDEQIMTIARGIDEYRSFAGARLDPKRHRLLNSDEPVTSFRVRA
jgi:hypothetical protein